MLTLAFMRYAREAGHRLWFRFEGVPPEYTWADLRAEGWTIDARQLRDADEVDYNAIDSVTDPDGVLIWRVASGAAYDEGHWTLNKPALRRYKSTVDRLIRKHFRGSNPHPSP